jgi:predicted ribosome quality control (RQC) complex YloA/Tae2 family protein
LDHGEQRESWKHYGDLLYANLPLVRKGASFVTIPDFDGETTVTIPLQETKSPQENAASYFKKYQKAKKAMEHIAKQKAETLLDIQVLKQTLYDITQADPIELAQIRLDLQPTKKPKQPHRLKNPINKLKIKPTSKLCIAPRCFVTH